MGLPRLFFLLSLGVLLCPVSAAISGPARDLMVFFIDTLTEDQYDINENLTNGGSERKGGG